MTMCGSSAPTPASPISAYIRGSSCISSIRCSVLSSWSAARCAQRASSWPESVETKVTAITRLFPRAARKQIGVESRPPDKSQLIVPPAWVRASTAANSACATVGAAEEGGTRGGSSEQQRGPADKVTRTADRMGTDDGA